MKSKITGTNKKQNKIKHKKPFALQVTVKNHKWRTQTVSLKNQKSFCWCAVVRQVRFLCRLWGLTWSSWFLPARAAAVSQSVKRAAVWRGPSSCSGASLGADSGVWRTATCGGGGRGEVGKTVVHLRPQLLEVWWEGGRLVEQAEHTAGSRWRRATPLGVMYIYVFFEELKITPTQTFTQYSTLPG